MSTASPPAVLTIGFRPFFFLASLFAVAGIPLWLIVYGGRVALATPLGPFGWHGHEMVFGFTMAVVAGFLLTAVRNWTGRPTPRGPVLAALAALWLLARVANLFAAELPSIVVSGLDFAFAALVANAIAVPIFASRSRRNYAFPFLLLVLGASNLLHHLRFQGVIPLGVERDPLTMAIAVVAIVIAIIGGRIVPAFTRNAIAPHPVAAPATLDRLALVVLVAACALHGLALVPRQVAGTLLVVAGLLNAARMTRWGTRHTLRIPILWILHASWAWLCLALVLQGLSAAIDALPHFASLHAMTVGAIGNFTLGMMARVSLGHTGRPLRVHWAIAVAFVLMNTAAVVRVFGPLVASMAIPAIHVAGALWTLAFLLYLIVYTPILFTPRADGKVD